MKGSNVLLVVAAILGGAWLLSNRQPAEAQTATGTPSIITIPSGTSGLGEMSGLLSSLSLGSLYASIPAAAPGPDSEDAGSILDQVTALITTLGVRAPSGVGELDTGISEDNFTNIIDAAFSRFTELVGESGGLVTVGGGGVQTTGPFVSTEQRYDPGMNLWQNLLNQAFGTRVTTDPPSTHYLRLYDAGQMEIEDIPEHRRWVVEDILAQRILNAPEEEAPTLPHLVIPTPGGVIRT